MPAPSLTQTGAPRYTPIMIRTGSRDDLPRLRELFASSNDAPYDLSVVAEEKCFEAGVFGEARLRVIEVDGRIAGAAVSCGKWLRLMIVDREARGRGLGSALLADAEELGVTDAVAEPGNYFTPGVAATDENTRQFMLDHGYERTTTTQNLEVDLGRFEPRAAARRAKAEEKETILAFIQREFGRIWRFEVARAFERDGLPPLFVTEENSEITGFAAHDINNRGLGFFGPTGVAKSMRGRGLGGLLLWSSLADMQRLGYRRAVIPWTDALAFYEKSCGAKSAHQFVAFAKRRT